MSTRQLKQLLILSLSILVILGCEEATEDAETQATFNMNLSQSMAKSAVDANTYNVVDEGGTTFTITEARVNVRHIQFDLPEDSEQDSTNKISLDGPFVFDLVNGTQTPTINAFEVEEGIYRRIDVRFDDAEASDALLPAGDELLDNTMLIAGTFDFDGTSGRNFRFVLKFNEDLRFEEPNGINVVEGETTEFFLSLNVTEWLAGIDITSCLDGGDLSLESNGDLIIEDGSGSDCQDLEGTIKSNIKNNYDLN